MLIRHLLQLKTVVFLHWCLLHIVLLFPLAPISSIFSNIYATNILANWHYHNMSTKWCLTNWLSAKWHGVKFFCCQKREKRWKEILIACVTIRPIDATHTQTAERVSKRALQAVAALAKAASTLIRRYMNFNVRKKRVWNVMHFRAKTRQFSI